MTSQYEGFEELPQFSGKVRAPARESVPGREIATPNETLVLKNAASLTPEPIAWLWPGYLARGKLHILGGAPGSGKTTLAMRMAATVTNGGHWPNGAYCPRGNVIIWSGEDDPQDTLVPRLIAAGADRAKVSFVDGVASGMGRRAFDPAKDTPLLREAVLSLGKVSLLIVDPIVSAVAGDSHKNSETRRALQPLVDLASELECALIGITHFSKGTNGREPLERITGSFAFGAMARIVFVAAKEQTDDGVDSDKPPRRIFVRAKSNIGPDDGGFAYELSQHDLENFPGVQASRVDWGEAIEGSARDILASAEEIESGDVGALGEAKSFLRELLADGPKSAKLVKADCEANGHTWVTVKRAKKSLGALATKDAFKGGWQWSLPPRGSTNTEGHQQNSVRPLGSFDTLREAHTNTDNIEIEL